MAAATMERTIVVAIDESDHSMHALEWALDTLIFSSQVSHAKIVLLHAKSTAASRAALSGPGFILSPELVVSMDKAQDREIAVFMDKALQMCQAKQVVAETKVATGDARDVICETVETVKPKFLVMGSHGYGTIKRVVLGSVSDYCAHHVKCPLVIVKKPHQKHDSKKEHEHV